MKGNVCIALSAKKTTVKDKIYSRILQYIAVHHVHGIGILIKSICEARALQMLFVYCVE